MFAGTAEHYLQFRPAYPEALLSLLRSRARTSGRGVLVDLACGPGRVAIPMARHFERVVAVDVEPEMLAVGDREACAHGVTNIEWHVGRAETLALDDHSVDLVTIGEAFHRLDQARVLRNTAKWLKRHGSLATLGGEPVWRGAEGWKRTLVDVVNEWTGDALGEPNDRPWGGPIDVLCAADLRVEEHELGVDTNWTCDSIVGFMYSTSIASRHVLGHKAPAFEAHLRAKLLACEPLDRFTCRQRFGFTLGAFRA